MKIGDQLICPKCGEPTVVKFRMEMDNWTPLGNVFACTLCGAKLGEITPEPSGIEKSAIAKNSFASLLGQTDNACVDKLVLDEKDRRFCRICNHCIIHPFFLKCDLNQSEVDPMSDCPNFSPKSKTN